MSVHLSSADELYRYVIISGAPPVIASASPSLVSVNMGENILIMCTATSKAPLTYMWYKDGEKLQGRGMNIHSHHVATSILALQPSIIIILKPCILSATQLGQCLV